MAKQTFNELIDAFEREIPKATTEDIAHIRQFMEKALATLTPVPVKGVSSVQDDAGADDSMESMFDNMPV